ncbi:MAG TPA: hypothetical protein VJ875_09665, partial [Pyrinomonadaceae bacterium]|nr:hypothetical protein [Pyrinomonadaceae bacterium]
DRLRKEKQKRHNDFKIVTSKPPEWQAERVFVGEGAMNFPALPVAESSYILLGRVTNAEAHLSENKKNVYSEFTISVEKVFKTADSSIIVGNEIVVDRIGGYVKCPNGRTLLYRVASTNMPAVNERYLLFLTSKNDQDFSILTAYALKSDGVSPLDDSPQLNSCGVSRKRLSYKSFEIPFHLLISPNTSCANDIVLQIIDSGH